MTMTAAELVASKKHILLDFDGPICAAFAGYGAANISRQLAILIAQEGIDVPPGLSASPDPFELLRYAAGHGDPELLADINSEFERLEAQAVRIAPPTPHAAYVLRALARNRHIITVVSNNSTQAIDLYCKTRQISSLLTGINGRVSADPSLLKPNPHLLLEALQERGISPAQAVMIGDSVSDISAARSADVAAIALINKPGKSTPLRRCAPDATVYAMTELLTH